MPGLQLSTEHGFRYPRPLRPLTPKFKYCALESLSNMDTYVVPSRIYRDPESPSQIDSGVYLKAVLEVYLKMVLVTIVTTIMSTISIIIIVLIFIIIIIRTPKI